MPLEITQRETNGIYLLALKGRLVLGEESSGLLTVIRVRAKLRLLQVSEDGGRGHSPLGHL